MSIKKIAICPFCRSEMECDEEAEIITKTILKENRNHIESSQRLYMYACRKCGFVAFWSGTPQ